MNEIEKKFIKHILLSRPQRPKELKNLMSFKEYIIFPYRDSIKKNQYPCFRCFSVGIIIDPNEMPDPVEGHKLSRRIKCIKCNGDKTSSSEEFKLEYKRRVDLWRYDLIAWKVLENDLIDLMLKLDYDDMELIINRTKPI